MTKITYTIWAAILLFACVQPVNTKTVVIKLLLKNKQPVNSVGIRGNGKPLSWETDFPMQALIKDSVYTATATVATAFSYTEIKFTVNNQFELKDKPNRKLVFSSKDTTYYTAIFDDTLNAKLENSY
ncbi:MAG: hypothetical protein ACOVNR_06215 [Chitinophagaceae bacterium]